MKNKLLFRKKFPEKNIPFFAARVTHRLPRINSGHNDTYITLSVMNLVVFE